MASKKSGININVDGFWLFLILLWVVVPTIKLFVGEEDKADTTTTTTAVVTKEVKSGKTVIMKIEDNAATVPVNRSIKIPISDEIARVSKTSPDGEEYKITDITSKYATTIFEQEGSWSLDTYDKDGLAVDWIRVTVY